MLFQSHVRSATLGKMETGRSTGRTTAGPAFWAGSVLAAALSGLISGVASSLFLYALDVVTRFRWQRGWITLLLPLAGLVIVQAYRRLGHGSERGNNLVIDVAHGRAERVPGSMAPLILLTTLLTHLVGGSAGREGTAVQMGAGLASSVLSWLGSGAVALRTLLLSGMAGGFGAVFGTPLAGAFFAVEVPSVGRIQWRQLPPCLVAAFVGHWTCIACGAVHTHYSVTADVEYIRGVGLWACGAAGILFGLCARLFAESLHRATALLARLPGGWWWKPMLAGLVLLGLAALVGTEAYLGLGVTGREPADPSIVRSFLMGGVTPWSWWWKLVFTVVTLAGGFRGGEVTPLFFIGAALGNAVAVLFGWPIDLFAALGFVAVFAAASHTPVSSALLGCELFGFRFAVPFALTCFVAHLASRGSGIYTAQEVCRNGVWQTLAEFRGRRGTR